MNESKPPESAPPCNSTNETLNLRLDAAKSAQERTRLAFFAVTVISFAMFTAGWNAHLSLYRDVSQEFSSMVHADTGQNKDKVTDPNSGVQELQRVFLRDYVDNRMINISWLGIRMGADDAPILGTVALIVTLLWFYLAVRRENFVIGWLLHDYWDADENLRHRIFHGINSFAIFTRALHIDEPFDTLEKFPKEKPARLLQSVTAKIYLLPLYAVYGVLLLEIVALSRSSPFRPVRQPLFFTLFDHHPWDLFWRLCRFAASVFLALFFVRRLCKRIQRFEEGTEKILGDFYRSIFPNGAERGTLPRNGPSQSAKNLLQSPQK